MPSRKDFQNISRTRLKEVKALHQNQLYDGAIYLSGYVIEAALKARICKLLDSDYPDSGEISKAFLTHKFDNLVRLGGLQRLMDKEKSENVDFMIHWSTVSEWNEAHRYKAVGGTTKNDVEKVITALEDKTNGVLTWIMKRW